MKKLLVSTIISFVALAAHAQEQEKKFYVQINAGGAYGINPKVRAENDDADIKNQKNIGSSPMFGLEAGYQINDKFRTSLSLDYLSNFQWTNSFYTDENDEDTTYLQKYKVKSLAGMLNLYYDITDIKGFKPYIVAGAGVSRHKAHYTLTQYYVKGNTSESFNQKGSNYSFAYKIGLGLRYSLCQNVDLDARYQFANLGKFKVKNAPYPEDAGTPGQTFPTISGSIKTHQFLLGASYKF